MILLQEPVVSSGRKRVSRECSCHIVVGTRGMRQRESAFLGAAIVKQLRVQAALGSL